MERTDFLLAYGKDFINKNPSLKDEVNDLIQLAFDEIEEGGSEEHEVELAINSIDELLLENLN